MRGRCVGDLHVKIVRAGRRSDRGASGSNVSIQTLMPSFSRLTTPDVRSVSSPPAPPRPPSVSPPPPHAAAQSPTRTLVLSDVCRDAPASHPPPPSQNARQPLARRLPVVQRQGGEKGGLPAPTGTVGARPVGAREGRPGQRGGPEGWRAGRRRSFAVAARVGHSAQLVQVVVEEGRSPGTCSIISSRAECCFGSFGILCGIGRLPLGRP